MIECRSVRYLSHMTF